MTNITNKYMYPGALSPVTLKGKSITLKPLNLKTDIPELYKVSNGSPITTKNKSIPSYDPREVLWKYFSWDNFYTEKEMKDYYEYMIINQFVHIFTLFDNETNSPIGSLGYGFISPRKLKVEIITVWVSPIAQGSGKCTEAVFLMIEHAFSVGYKFIHWGCYTENLRSRRMPERLGFRLVEYIGDYCCKGNKVFDLIIFEISEREWEIRKQGPCWWGF